MAQSNPSALSLHSGWWTRLPDGSIRRVWVARKAQAYHCQVKTTTPEQEAALQRLAALDYGLDKRGRHDEDSLIGDARLLAEVAVATLRTTSARKALAFLGGDNAALLALIEADPSLRPEFPGA